MEILVKERQGYYCGTEVNGKWWKRSTKKGFFARGLGTFWIDDIGLSFRKYLTKNPFSISFNSIIDIKIGKWHAGRWGHGYQVCKIIWKEDYKILSSGFIFAKEKNELDRIISIIGNKAGIRVLEI